MPIDPALRPGMIQLSTVPVAVVPLSHREKRDKALLPLRRYEKEVKEADTNRTGSNAVQAATIGTLAGALLGGRGGALKGAAAGLGGLAAVRIATRSSRDFYGERFPAAKRAETLPALAGGVIAALAAKRRIKATLAKAPRLLAARHRLPVELEARARFASGPTEEDRRRGALKGAAIFGGLSILGRGRPLKAAAVGGVLGALAARRKLASDRDNQGL